MKVVRVIVSLIPLLLSVFAVGQTFEKDMEQVNKRFVNNNRIAYQINYVLKESHDVNSKVLSKNSGRYVKQNDKILSQYDKQFTLITANQVVMVNKDEARILVKQQASKENTSPDVIAQLNEYNKQIEKVVRLTTNKKDVIMYSVELKKNPLSPISKYEISINTSTFYMEQMTLFYKGTLDRDEENNIKGTEVPRLDIIFYDFNAGKLFTPQELEPSYYYVKSDKKYLPSANFKNYVVKELF